MKRFRRLLLLSLFVLPLVSCTKGNECDQCQEDADCKEGFLCTSFSDGSKRCGSGLGATTCRVR
jgi:hypothetical protein